MVENAVTCITYAAWSPGERGEIMRRVVRRAKSQPPARLRPTRLEMHIRPVLQQDLHSSLKTRVDGRVQRRFAVCVVAVDDAALADADRVLEQQLEQRLAPVHDGPVQCRPVLAVEAAEARPVRQQRAYDVLEPADCRVDQGGLLPWQRCCQQTVNSQFFLLPLPLILLDRKESSYELDPRCPSRCNQYCVAVARKQSDCAPSAPPCAAGSATCSQVLTPAETADRPCSSRGRRPPAPGWWRRKGARWCGMRCKPCARPLSRPRIMRRVRPTWMPESPDG
ncbi:hypothetical protein N656DRAFT_648060 [Canariomyces notabilis]|uniref:Uncharacterized protein n=1 Tax=Canariomyces notabilis TaxID=2074819 RepID=A0AAN6TEX9_9PEZI|nr:hypothetical protein N656DRAFT_648060 [Canariomyces arenarius]